MDIRMLCETYTLQQFIAEGRNFHEKDDEGNTCLHLACRYGNLPLFRDFIFEGMDINVKNVYGYTPLHWASRYGHLDIVRELIPITNVDELNGDGMTPLHLASRENHLLVVRELIKHGSNVCAQSNTGSTPLFIASLNENITIVQELLPLSDVSLKNNNGKTALDVTHNDEIRDLIKMYQELPDIKEPMED